jgi:hypothetical protein
VRRREFITLLGGAAAARSRGANAQLLGKPAQSLIIGQIDGTEHGGSANAGSRSFVHDPARCIISIS